MIDSEGTQVKSELSPGKQLSQGRLQLGLTQEQVAKELYITLAKIKALESDDYGRLNTDTFIRGYIRAYANLLKLDVVEILAAYDQVVQDKSSQADLALAAKIEAPAPVRSSKIAMQFLLIIGVFFFGLWLISVWFFDNHPDKNYAALDTSVQALSSSSENGVPSAASDTSLAVDALADQPVVSADPEPSRGLASKSSVERSVGDSSVAKATVTSAAVQESSRLSAAAANAPATPAKTGQATSATSLDTITFNFRGESWLEVSDSRGDVLATELQAGGSKLTLVGKAPFDVKLGNAPVVDIQLNDKKIDVIPLLGSNVLTLRVKN